MGRHTIALVGSDLRLTPVVANSNALIITVPRVWGDNALYTVGQNYNSSTWALVSLTLEYFQLLSKHNYPGVPVEEIIAMQQRMGLGQRHSHSLSIKEVIAASKDKTPEGISSQNMGLTVIPIMRRFTSYPLVIPKLWADHALYTYEDGLWALNSLTPDTYTIWSRRAYPDLDIDELIP
mgnify:CR=1 FL=1